MIIQTQTLKQKLESVILDTLIINPLIASDSLLEMKDHYIIRFAPVPVEKSYFSPVDDII